MRRVDQTAQIVGCPVAPGRRKERDAVVAPVARAGKVGHRHQFDRRDAERREVGQPRCHAGKRSLWAERPDVQLVEDDVVEIEAGPLIVGPVERTRVHDLRRPVHAFWLKPRCRIGKQAVVVETIAIAVAGANVGKDGRKDAIRRSSEWMDAPARQDARR